VLIESGRGRPLDDRRLLGQHHRSLALALIDSLEYAIGRDGTD
jgi:hypothetical protein